VTPATLVLRNVSAELVADPPMTIDDVFGTTTPPMVSSTIGANATVGIEPNVTLVLLFDDAKIVTRESVVVPEV
jgi:hypothetical protein